ncbi:MAG: VCBS repeat-containing protein, partial [Acidimicrobiia bacterium]
MTAQPDQMPPRPWLVLLGLVLGLSIVGLVALLFSNTDGDDSRGAALPAPLLVDVSSSAGVDQVYEGGFEFFVGGGVAVFDCDGDRKPELFVAGGSMPAGLFLNDSDIGGDLAFHPMSSPVTDLVGVTGAYPLDVDSDRITDLVVLRRGENVVLRGLGDCEFEQANQRWGIGGGAEWTAAFSAMWEPRAELPTLVFGNYLAIEDNKDRSRCDDHRLFRPEGGSYPEPDTLGPGWCTLSVLFSDWDGSGSPDLRVTNDRHYYRDGQEQMWSFDPGDEPRLYTQEDGWARMEIWGMGIASQDLDDDGLPEVFLTSQGDNKLQTLAAGPDEPSYEDEALALGVTAHRPFVGDTDLPSTAWHAEFDDVNNDGYLDLLVTKGNVDAQEG